MTRDEVMAMTDDELRVKAAELMGWRFIGVLPVPGSLGESSYRTWEGEYGIVATIESDQPNLTKDNYLPDYPNDIAAAWELFDIMSRAGKWPMLAGWCPCADTERQEDCAEPFSCGFSVDASDDNTDEVFAASGAKAITRAFILAMEANDGA